MAFIAGNDIVNFFKHGQFSLCMKDAINIIFTRDFELVCRLRTPRPHFFPFVFQGIAVDEVGNQSTARLTACAP